MVRKIILVIVFFLMSSIANAADFTASVDNNSVTVGDTIQLTLQLSGASSKNPPEISALNNSFSILGQQQSSSTIIVNGDVSSTKSWIYAIAPKAAGKITIAPFTIETKDGTLKTDSITIDVSKNTIPTPAQSSNVHLGNKKVSLTASVSKNNPYKNEPIIYRLEMVSKGPLVKVYPPDINIDNAVVEPQGRLKAIDKIINGKQTQVVEAVYKITPLKEGKLVLPSVIMHGEMEGDLPAIDDQFKMMNNLGNIPNFANFGGIEPFSVAATEVTLDVGVPNNQLQNWLPAESVTLAEEFNIGTPKVGEPLTRKFTIHVEGNSSSQLPSLESQQANKDEFKVYADKPVTKDDIKANHITASSEQTFTLVPQKPGKFTLPEITIPWWDVNNNKIAYTKLPEKTFDVLPGAEAANVPAKDLSSQQEKKENPVTPVTEKVPQKQNIILYVIIGLLFAVLIAVVIWVVALQKRIGLIKSGASVKIQPANKIEVGTKMSNNDISSVNTAEELNDFLKNYAAENWGVPKNSPIENIFANQNIKKEEIEPLIKELNAALYANKQVDIENLKQQYNDVIAAANKKIKTTKQSKKLPSLNPS